MSTQVSFYKILEVSDDADAAQIKDSYRRLVRRHHPDANPHHQERAETLMKEIIEAYATLGDPEKRARYDAETRLHAFENRFKNSGIYESVTVNEANLPVSLLGRIRVILSFDAADFASRLGIAEGALASMESRDEIPLAPIQFRTFTNFCEQAVAKAKADGNFTLASEMQTSFARKKSRRGIWK